MKRLKNNVKYRPPFLAYFTPTFSIYYHKKTALRVRQGLYYYI